MGKKHDIIIIIVCGIIFFAIYSASYMTRNYSAAETDVVISLSDAPEMTETMTTYSGSVVTTSSSFTTTAAPEAPLHLDINTADKDELMKLPGIGDVLADAIISYRTGCVKFNNIEELMLVNGVGEGIFSRIRDNIYVTDPWYPPVEEAAPLPVAEYEEDALPSEEQADPEPTLEDSIPININAADRSTLLLLPHISEETADSIISLREQLGGFKSEYELLLVKELTQEQISEIMNYIII